MDKGIAFEKASKIANEFNIKSVDKNRSRITLDEIITKDSILYYPIELILTEIIIDIIEKRKGIILVKISGKVSDFSLINFFNIIGSRMKKHKRIFYLSKLTEEFNKAFDA